MNSKEKHLAFVYENILKTNDSTVIETLSNASRIVNYNCGEYIRKDSDPMYEVFFCAEGIYKHVKYDLTGKEIFCCSNLDASSATVLNEDFDIFSDNNVFAGDCIAITDCVIVAVPMSVIKLLFQSSLEFRAVVTYIYSSAMKYYHRLASIQSLKGIERYKFALKDIDMKRWNLLNDSTKALFLNLDYSYWLKMKKKYNLE